MRIRLLPPSSEGFLRLAKAVAIVAFIATIVFCVRDTSRWQSERVKTFRDIHSLQDQMCLDFPGSPKLHECLAASAKVYDDGVAAIYERSWPVTLKSWGSYTGWGLAGAYIAALCTRTLGWIALGFRKPAQA
jgi:hypothetical protein